MALVINGITCEEIVHNYGEEVDLLRGPSANKEYLCNWSDRFTVARGLLGLAATTRIGGSITLYTPLQHPELSTTYAHRIQIRGAGCPLQGSRQLAFPKAIVTCIYETMPWSFQPFDAPYNQIDPTHPFIYAEQRLKSGYELIAVPGSNLKFSTGGKPLQSEMTLHVALVEMEITIKQLPYMPTNVVLAMAGTLNNAQYLGVNTGCLKFNGVTTQTGAVSDGTFIQEATYGFTARGIRWDSFYNPDIWDFDIVTRTNGDPIYLMKDFTQIIPFYYQY